MSSKTCLARWVCAALCLLLLSLPAAAEIAEASGAKTVRVAYVLSQGYQEGGEGEYKTGYGYEYLQMIAAITGWEYTYVYGSFGELLTMLENGEVDLMGNLSYTEERAQHIAFGRCEQGRESFYLYVNRKTNTIKTDNPDTINGKKIGISVGTYQETLWRQWCEERGITCEIVEYKTLAERKEALNSGEIDATVGSAVQDDETTADWRVLMNLGSAPFYFGVNQSRPDLLEELNNAQAQILQDNPFYNEEVQDRFMKSISLSTTTLSDEEDAWLQSHDGTVRVGYLTGFRPLSFTDADGGFDGVVADVLATMQAQYAADGLRFETVPYTAYDEMLTDLHSGLLDAAWPVYFDYCNAEKKDVGLTDPVITTTMHLVYDGTYDASKLDKVAVVTNGSATRAYATIYLPDSEIVAYADYAEAVSAVCRHEVGCLLYVTPIYNVDVETNENLRTLTAYLLPKTFSIALATVRGDWPIVSILNKGLSVVGEDAINHSLLVHSAVHKTTTLRDYLRDNPTITNIFIGTSIFVLAGVALLIVYSKMRLRIKTGQAEKETFRRLSNSDLLTGLYNRKAVFTRCGELLREHPQAPFTMMHLDVLNFRLFNTFFGDEVGDRLLCDIGDFLRDITADYPYCAFGRIEADVFCLFYPYDEQTYQKHLHEFSKRFKDYRTDFPVISKVGLYFVTDPEMPPEAMFTRATIAAREAQPGTLHLSCVYNADMEKALNLRQRVLNEMRPALTQGQFHVWLQPKYSLRNNRMVGAEALVRWIHPTKGVISPSVFIPVFESNGLITQLDHYMWEQVCRLLARWQAEGKPLLPVSVNISRLSMYGSTTVHILKMLVRKYGIDPKYLELELTESAFMDRPEEMKQQLIALREAGFVILLDDFGSGYSALNTVRELPVDILKMDMKFLPLEQSDIRGELVISSVVRMAKLLHLRVIAEGVETQAQADYLKSVGCEYVQGYLFARPMPVDEYEQRLRRGETTPMVAVNQTTMEHIGKILAESGSGTHAMGMVIPVPLACLEYNADHSFSFLRVNPAFYTEFHYTDDHISGSGLFRAHLSAQSAEELTRAMEDCVRGEGQTTTTLQWNGDDGTCKSYLVRLAYEGNVGDTAAFVAVFMPATAR